MNPNERCSDSCDGCSECTRAISRCENCFAAIETPVIDPNDAGIVYCSPECRDEFVAVAELMAIAAASLLPGPSATLFLHRNGPMWSDFTWVNRPSDDRDGTATAAESVRP